MKTSENGINLIKGFEGFEQTPYRDVAGFMTIGYGHKLKPTEFYDDITVNDAEKLLVTDLRYAETILQRYVTVDLNQNQFDALVSFVFNVGEGMEGVKDGFVALRSGKPSTMLQCLNAGDFDGAAAQFDNWDHADGIEVKGLLDRREKEKALFIMPQDAA